MIEHKDRVEMTALQLQMYLKKIDTHELKEVFFENISGMEIRNIMFNLWKEGNHIKKYNIERVIRRINKRNVSSEENL